VDYTIKLIAPAAGDKIVARGRVVRAGRTLSVTASDVYVVREGKEALCATALATIRNFEASGS
jgi:acyl-coenzyme A thioesterase PaaI-like protein